MKVLCVEDGSVNVDAIESGELKDGKILVYRQGSKPPFVLDIPDETSAAYKKFIVVWEELKRFIEENEYWSEFAKDALKKMEEIENNKFELEKE